MSKTRILMVPYFFGLPSHFIPLVKLYQRLPRDRYEVAFFLPRRSLEDLAANKIKDFNAKARYYYSEEFLSRFQLPMLDLNQRFGVIGELAACNRFQPDLIIDDSNLSTALARRIQWRPRLAIARTGVFGDPSRASGYPHSLVSMIDKLYVPPGLHFDMPQSVDAYFEAEAHIIPATRSLEPLPGLPQGGHRAFYSGPLILDEREESLFHSPSLEGFLEANRGRRVAYVTFGIDASKQPHSKVWECLRDLLRRGFAIVTNMTPAEPLVDASELFQQRNYFHSAALPMHYVCSRADLIVHICGSAAYHYPILHGKPAITIGTQCRDREEVARTLCERGLSYHLQAPAETEAFTERFAEALDLHETGRFPFDEGLRGRLEAHRLEMQSAGASFSLDTAIEAALSAARP